MCVRIVNAVCGVIVKRLILGECRVIGKQRSVTGISFNSISAEPGLDFGVCCDRKDCKGGTGENIGRNLLCYSVKSQ